MATKAKAVSAQIEAAYEIASILGEFSDKERKEIVKFALNEIVGGN